MVICSFFLKGNCRFGDSCKNEHSYNETPSSVLLKKTEVDENALIRSAAGDMLKADTGNQWPLSCFGPFQAKPCFPGFEDKCFEEIRLGFYEAQCNGTLEQYKAQLTSLLQEARMKMKSLQNPTQEAANMLKEIYYSNSSNNQNSIFGNQNSQSIFNANTTQQNSIFGNVPESHTNNIFNNAMKANSVGQPSANSFSFAVPENKSIFGNMQTATPTQPFQSNNSPNFFQTSNQQSIFSSMVPQPAQPYASNSIFQNAAPQNTVVPSNHSQSIFSSPAPTPTSPPAFASSPFNMQNTPVTGANYPKDNATNVNPFLNVNKNVPSNVNPFHNAANVSPLLPNPGFNTEPAQAHNPSIFGNKTLLMTPVNVKKTDDHSIYSRISDLSSNDVAEYEKHCFDFGKIPTRAPSLQMC